MRIPVHERFAKFVPAGMAFVWICAITLAQIIFATTLTAGEGFSAFRYVGEPEKPSPESALQAAQKKSTKAKRGTSMRPSVSAGNMYSPAAGAFGPVPTKFVSLVNAAPLLLPYVNNAPVFGVPGTVVGDFWNRTQVTGDWGGTRTELARKGFFFDAYTTTTYQNVTSGGIKTGESGYNNTQISANIDTGRAGWWSGGLLHFTAQARNGSAPDETFNVGSYVPHHYGLLLPGPELSNNIYPSDFYIAQALGPQVSVIVGKISGLFLPDQTLFANTYKYAFTNFNFNKNPFFANFYGPTAWAALGVWIPAQWLVLEGGVLDPNSKGDNFAKDAFDRVNIYGQATFNYAPGGLPGQLSVAGNWTNKPKIDLQSPFTLTFPSQLSQGLALLTTNTLTQTLPTATSAPAGLPAISINYKGESWFSIANFSQYLYVMDDPREIAPLLKSGQLLRGVGVFGRFGYSPAETNIVDRHASIGLFAHGLLDTRKYDSFGVAYYYNGISSDLKNTVSRLTSGGLTIEDEKGIEVFYDFAVTPAIRLIPSYQHIWNPLLAQVQSRANHADVFLTRATIAW
ncbi:MAG: carbohydrate porin [Bradyrhizobium sp.]